MQVPWALPWAAVYEVVLLLVVAIGPAALWLLRGWGRVWWSMG